MNGGSESNKNCMPPERRSRAEEMRNKSLPQKSSKRYQQRYNLFLKWKLQHDVAVTSENVILAYIEELSKEMAPNTLWSVYSMLKRYIKRYENINIKNYTELQSFLKANAKGYHPKKAAVFLDRDLDRFLAEAPDALYLVHKVC